MLAKQKIIFGVCKWVADKLNIDATVVRIAFILFIFLGGSGFLLYFVLWIVKILEEK